MKKSLLLSCLFALVATFGMAQSTTWPITLNAEDGLPGTEIETGLYNYKSEQFTLDEAITTLRYTVTQTLCSSKLPDNAESYRGRMTWSPGFPYFTLGELIVYNEAGEPVEYIASSNAGHVSDGALEHLNDGDITTHFHTNWETGVIDSDYHYVEIEFAEPISIFSIEWTTRYNYRYNQPMYVGLTPGGESYWPMPEQELKVEKISTLEELAEPNSLFMLEGHVESWYDESRGRTNVGGGFYEAPCLATGQPSAFGVFTLIPVAEKENTYKVEYINTDHYIWAKGSAGEGFIDWTMDIRKAMEIKFSADATNAGDFILTSLEDSLLIMQDAIMRMGCLKNNPYAEAAFLEKRPFAKNFSIYKADIKASTILYKLEDAIAVAEERLASNGTSLDDYDEGQKANLETALEAAKAVAAKSDATVAEILAARNELNTKINDFHSLSLWLWVDSIAAIMDAMDEGLILTSSAPDWINNSYPEEYKETLTAAIDEADVVFATYTTLADIDEAIANVKAIIDGFWASKISNVKNLPFRLGREEDGLPGERSNSVYRWESPTYYLTEEVDQLRFTVFKTKSQRMFSGSDKPFVCINEFELFDQNGQKIALTAESFETNSIAPSDGKGFNGLVDGNTNNGNHFHSQWQASGDTDYDGSEYFYLDITLPEAIGGFKFIQHARGNGYDDAPIDFVFGYYGELVTPEEVMFPDDYNAMLGSQIESIEEITDNGIYAIKGLINCNPDVVDEPEEGGFYSKHSRWIGGVQSPCAFAIRSTGDSDGTYYIQNLSDGSYWMSTRSNHPDYWTSGTSTIYKSKAAKVKIEPNNNDALPYSFVIYEYVEESYRELDGEDTQCPYVIAQDWGSGLGWYNVSSLENNDTDGEGEWYIYRMSMDTPYSYWLGNLAKSYANIGLVESNDPGRYKDLGNFPAALAAAQVAAEAKDEATSKAMIATLEAALADVENLASNPIVPGVYVIEANQPAFFQNQKTKKAIYFANPHTCGTYCGEIELSWKDSPANIMEADSSFLFELIPAADDEKVAVWLEDSLITPDQLQNAYYLKSVKFNTYVTRPSEETIDANQSWYGIHLSTSETPEPYFVFLHDGAAVDIWMPGGGEYNESENGNLSFHVQDHGNGDGVSGHVVYWLRGNVNSLWNLRLVKESTTGISAPVVEGEEVVSTTYYTADGAVVPAPVKGVNIVKYVYSNGAVKSVKFVK
ncbi:MAG: FIVAR domain-containing protein [Bacteroidaceae bacterium]|nr:FIVAR domain-containing protein [Bacteroidaceae bacterium]